MVTYFNRKDLVSFGNYLLSDERTQKKLALIPESNQQISDRYESTKQVSHADIENWMHKESEKPKEPKTLLVLSDE